MVCIKKQAGIPISIINALQPNYAVSRKAKTRLEHLPKNDTNAGAQAYCTQRPVGTKSW
jgi:predicted xylose isomerase-like sugar epimerase